MPTSSSSLAEFLRRIQQVLEAVGQLGHREVERLKSDLLERAIARERHLRPARRMGGQTRGQQIADGAADSDDKIRRLVRFWRSDSDVRHEYPSVIGYVQSKTGLPRWTVRRRLKKLNIPTTRQ